MTASCDHTDPRPFPSIIMILNASLRCVEGNIFEKIIRKFGIMLAGKKIPPRKSIRKNTIIHIGVALLVLFIRLARAKPILRKHIAPKVRTSQK